MKTVILAVMFCLVVVAQSLAFDEPDNFAGLKFDEDVRTQLSKCGPGQERYTKKERCYIEIGGGYPRGWLFNLGEISNMVGEIFYEQIDNKLLFSKGLSLDYDHIEREIR